MSRWHRASFLRFPALMDSLSHFLSVFVAYIAQHHPRNENVLPYSLVLTEVVLGRLALCSDSWIVCGFFSTLIYRRELESQSTIW